jgi:peptidoglycan/LPS O-acetylase OafA/YrhL
VDGWLLGRRPGLDAIRGGAVALVLLAHVFGGPASWAGAVGVTSFFVLSGFLVTRLLIEEVDRTSGVDVLAFYGRRARRLLPPLPIAVALAAAANAAYGLDWTRHAAAAVTGTSNLASMWLSDSAGSFRHLWSLAVEIQFYLVWPVVVAVVPRRWLPVLCAGVAAAAISYRLQVSDDFLLANYGTRTRIGAMLIGSLLALRPRWQPSAPTVVAAAAVLATFCLTGSRLLFQAWGATAVAVAAAVVVAAALGITRSVQGLGWLGEISYGVYLFHLPIARLVRRLGEGWPWGVLVVALSLALAVVSHRLVEAPFRRAPIRSAATA